MVSLALRLAKRSTMRTGGDGGEEGSHGDEDGGRKREKRSRERAKKPSISRI
ncbi:putative disks large-associated protein 4 [Sesbania bispinosa]|nr:putative disks large-associated protein 4 [Sesbania bispinosa]